MVETMSDYPHLQAEDDGFLMHVRDDIILPHLPSLGLNSSDSLLACIEKLKQSNESVAGVGASLPFYIPAFDDKGQVAGMHATVVWSGVRIDVPLYGNLNRAEVERLILGKQITPAAPCEEFMSYSPAFRVALLVHHICQIVLINPLAAEAFALGRYESLGHSDAHYDKWHVPTTEFMHISYTSGLNTEWRASSPHGYACTHNLEPHINGWEVHIRGAMPKRETLVNAWLETREQLDAPKEASFTIAGKKMKRLGAKKGSGRRKRVGDPDVELMCRWVDSNLDQGSFPMRGTRKNWKEAVAKFGNTHQALADRWTADSMRKAYQHHKALE